ncbi:MAG: Flp pilus assembly complex ATPase component TadA, partial [Polyangiaceae bacterium]|nr:Flp pilus assembly complex ATPase component TadA [Polyangiaceae bacterium]
STHRWGKRVVLRMVDGGRATPSLAHLGFSPMIEGKLQELLQKPQGLIIVSGPVGSGKTTTLYSCLQEVHESKSGTSTIVTLEDPIEVQLPFASQTQVDRKRGLDFAAALRSILRQDPNVLMLGEIRDAETAAIATQAGLTGHMILTTLHVDSAIGTFARLSDMGVKDFVLSGAVIGCLSQRLVRSLCTSCRQEAPVDAHLRQRFESLGVPLEQNVCYQPKGCEFCEGTGYTGRLILSEIFEVNPKVAAALSRGASTAELQQLSVEQGMKPLILTGLERAARGETSLEEVLRVCG